MNQVNTVIQKLPSSVVPYAQLLVLALTSFVSNTVVAGRSLYLCATNVSKFKLSYKEYVKVVQNEIENSKSLLVFNSGVFVAMFYCLHLLWNLTFVLVFAGLFCSFWWVLLWCVLLFVREKYGDLIWKTLKRYEFVENNVEQSQQINNSSQTLNMSENAHDTSDETQNEKSNEKNEENHEKKD